MAQQGSPEPLAKISAKTVLALYNIVSREGQNVTIKTNFFKKILISNFLSLLQQPSLSSNVENFHRFLFL